MANDINVAPVVGIPEFTRLLGLYHTGRATPQDEHALVLTALALIPRDLHAFAAATLAVTLASDDGRPLTNQYEPDEVSPPVDTIRETLEEMDLDWTALAEEGGLTKQHALMIWKGTAHITGQVAVALARVTGVPAPFWEARQRRYVESRREERAS